VSNETVPGSEGGGLSGLANLAMLSDRTSDRVRKLIGTYMVGMTAYRIGKKWYDRSRAEATHSVSIAANDDIYPDVHVWLLEQIPEHKRRALTAKSQPPSPSSPMTIDGGENKSEGFLRLSYDGTRTQKVELDGHPVTVSLERPDWEKMTEFSRDRFVDRIIFTAGSVDGRNAVVAFLQSVVANRAKRTPRFYALSRWGEWRHQSDVPMRPLSTVVLAGGQRESLVEDLDRFLGEESDYARMGIPWHRGYLFSGPPGTGKSSIAGSLAAHFALDVYFMALSSVKDDVSLAALLGEVRPRSVIVLEDVDIIHSSRSRTDDSPGVQMDGLLNALDGMLTPHGSIFILTSNHPEVLDEALIRPGRVDLSMEFGYLDADHLHRLLSVFMGTVPSLPALTARITPADVVDVLKRHLGEPQSANEELAALVRSVDDLGAVLASMGNPDGVA
jgi:hypothetical protein